MDWSRVREALRQGCVDPFHAACYHGGKGGGAPPAPDYRGAAEATAKSQQVSQYTPYGSQVYSADPSAPSGYRSTIDLAPVAQQTLDSQMGLSRDLGNLATSYLPNVQSTYGRPMDLQSVQDVSDKAYGAMTSRLDPQWDMRDEQMRTRLYNQGVREGSEAWDNAQREFSQARNDAYQQANLGAIQTMPQTYQLANAQYMQPLNILNAMRSGAQVQNPQFSSPGAGTNYLGAATAQNQAALQGYGIDQGANNSFMNGLFTLGGLALGGPIGGMVGRGVGGLFTGS